MAPLIEHVSNVETSAEKLLAAVRRDHPELTPVDFRPALTGLTKTATLLRLSLIRFGGVLHAYYQLAEQNRHLKPGTGDARRNKCRAAALKVGIVSRHSEAALNALYKNIGRTAAFAAREQNPIGAAAQQLSTDAHELSLTAANITPPTVEDLKNFTYMEDMLASLLNTVEHLGFRHGACRHLPDLFVAAHQSVGMPRKARPLESAITAYGQAMDKAAKPLRDAYGEVGGDLTRFNAIAKAAAS